MTDTPRHPGSPGHPAGHPGGHPGGGPSGPPSDPATFDRAYEGTPSWDIGRPQPAVVRALDAGLFGAAVLDVGCGTGQDARLLAARGHAVTGVDFSPRGIERALAGEPTAASFAVADVRDLASAGFGPGAVQVDTVLDVGCFHALARADRGRYAASVGGALRPGGRLVLFCFSDRNAFAGGPARLSDAELRAVFADGWTVESLDDEVLESPREPGRVDVWRLVARRA
ncbi:MAG: methyltransferase domain-containing protein [Chloroflexota bacterium]